MSHTPVPAPLLTSFAGVLLDMDGTLVDSIAVVERSWLRWAEEYGIDPRRLAGSHGVTGQNIIADLLPEDRREEAFARILEIETADVADVVPLPGAVDLLGALDEAGVPTAIVTSSPRTLADVRLEVTGLPRPAVVVTASDVERGKPHPDPWLAGATGLGLDPGRCLVLEDAAAGLRAARDAGCGGLVAVTTTMARADLEPLADLVVAGLTSLRVEVSRGSARVVGWDA